MDRRALVLRFCAVCFDEGVTRQNFAGDCVRLWVQQSTFVTNYVYKQNLHGYIKFYRLHKPISPKSPISQQSAPHFVQTSHLNTHKNMRGVHSRATPTTAQTHRHRCIAVRAAAPTTTLVTKTKQRQQQRQVFKYSQIELETGPGVSIHNITPQIKQAVEEAGISDGFVNILSR
jgi:hypothetical protein